MRVRPRRAMELAQIADPVADPGGDTLSVRDRFERRDLGTAPARLVDILGRLRGRRTRRHEIRRIATWRRSTLCKEWREQPEGESSIGPRTRRGDRRSKRRAL